MSDSDSLESVLGNDGDGLGGEVMPLETPTEEAPGDETNTEAPPAEDAPKAENPVEPKKPDEDADAMVPKRAVLDERRKRQAAEQRIADLEAQLKPASATPEPKARPDVFENQEAAFAFMEQRFEEKLLAQRIVTSREDMQERHADYDEKEQLFVELAAKDPSLISKMQSAARPAKFVYDHVVKHLQQQDMQDPAAYEAKIRAKVLAELEAERAAKGEEAEPSPDDKMPPPPQLVNRRSAAKEPVQLESLEDVVGN